MASDIFYSYFVSGIFNSGICSSPNEAIRIKVDDKSTFDFIFGKVERVFLSEENNLGYYKLRITTTGGYFDFISKDDTKLKSIISFFPELKDSI